MGSEPRRQGARRRVPPFGRGTRVYSGVLTGDPVTGKDHDLVVYAEYNETDGFELCIYDSASWPVKDQDFALWVTPEHTPALLNAVGALSTDDLIERLTQRLSDGSIPVKEGEWIERVCLPRWFRDNGVEYTSDSAQHDN